MFCRNCGKKLNNGDRFCSSCGAKVEDQVVSFSFGSSGEKGLGLGLEPRREPERKPQESGRRLMDMSWDIDGYPGEKAQAKKSDTAEVDFNWNTILKNREESGAYNEPDTEMTEEELFVKLTKDTARTSTSPGPSWERGSTARFEKPAGGKGLGPNDSTMPFMRPTRDQVEINVIDLGGFGGVPEDIDEDYPGDREFMPSQDDFRPPYRDEIAYSQEEEEVEPRQEVYLSDYEPQVPRMRKVEPFIADQDELYEEMQETIQAAEEVPQKSPIDKFYTFNQKSEEFRALLDQEYARLKARLEAGKEEEESLAERRAKLRAREAERERLAMEQEQARLAEEERIAQAEAEVQRKAEEEKRLIEEEQRLFAESRALVEEQERIKAEEEARKKAEEEALAALEAAALANLEESKPETEGEEEIPFGYEAQQEDASEEIGTKELAKAELDALAAADLEALAIAQANAEVVLTKPNRRIVEVEEEKLPRVAVALPEETLEERLSELELSEDEEGQVKDNIADVNVPAAFASVEWEAEEIEEELEGQEEIDFSNIGELDPAQEEGEPETEEEVVDQDVEPEIEEAEQEAKAEVVEEREIGIHEESEMPIEEAEEALANGVLPGSEGEKSEIDELDAELDLLAEKLDKFRAEVESGEALSKDSEEIASENRGAADAVTADEAAGEIVDAEAQAKDEEVTGESLEKEAQEEVSQEDSSQEEHKTLRYKDIFEGDEEGENKEKGERRGKFILLDILIFLLAILVILSAIMVFFPGSAVANRIQDGADRVISIFTGNAAETTEESSVQKLSMIEKAISDNLEKNRNIESVTEDADLVYREDVVYNITGIGESKPFIDSQWFTDESGKAVNYSGAIIGTAIDYYSKLLGRMNNADDEVLAMISPETYLYREVSAITPEPGVKNTISSLQIGSIRSVEKDHYLLVRVSQGKEGSEEQEITTKVMHFIQGEKELKVAEIADVK